MSMEVRKLFRNILYDLFKARQCAMPYYLVAEGEIRNEGGLEREKKNYRSIKRCKIKPNCAAKQLLIVNTFSLGCSLIKSVKHR